MNELPIKSATFRKQFCCSDLPNSSQIVKHALSSNSVLLAYVSLTIFPREVLFLNLNNNRSLDAAAVIMRFRSKQGLCLRFIVCEEKGNCQLALSLP